MRAIIDCAARCTGCNDSGRLVARLDRKRLGQDTLPTEWNSIRGVFDKQDKEEAAGVCGGRGALWDLNGGLGRNRSMDGQRKRRSRDVRRCRELQECRRRVVREVVEHRVSTRMHRRAKAHPRVATDGRVRKNRSTCMLIVPPQ